MLELDIVFSPLFAMPVTQKEIPEHPERLFLIGEQKLFLPGIPVLQNYMIRLDSLTNWLGVEEKLVRTQTTNWQKYLSPQWADLLFTTSS